MSLIRWCPLAKCVKNCHSAGGSDIYTISNSGVTYKIDVSQVAGTSIVVVPGQWPAPDTYTLNITMAGGTEINATGYTSSSNATSAETAIWNAKNGTGSIPCGFYTLVTVPNEALSTRTRVVEECGIAANSKSSAYFRSFNVREFKKVDSETSDPDESAASSMGKIG